MPIQYESARPSDPQSSGAVPVYRPDAGAADLRTNGSVQSDVEEYLFATGDLRGIELEVKTPNGDAFVQRFDRPCIVIGSAERSDLCLRHPEVSYRHAYFQLMEGRLLCIDLDSQGGIVWNGTKRSSGWVAPASTVQIGPFSIRNVAKGQAKKHLLSSGTASAHGPCRTRSSPADNFLLPPVSLLLNKPDNKQGLRRIELSGPLTLVGRSRRCELQLNHSSVSQIHCSLLLTPTGLWVADLLGRGGTRVNGRVVRFAKLKTGDELVVGRFAIQTDYAECNACSGKVIGSPSMFESGFAGDSRPVSGGLSEEFEPPAVEQSSNVQQQFSAQDLEQMISTTQITDGTQHEEEKRSREEMAKNHMVARESPSLHTELGRSARPALLETQSGTAEPVALKEPASGKGAHSKSTSSPGSQTAFIENSLNDSETSPREETCHGSAHQGSTEELVSNEPSQNGTGPASDGPSETSFYAYREPQTGQKRSNGQSAERHAWLMERLQEIERKRTSRWRRFKQLLTGHGSK